MKETGIEWVAVHYWWYQENATSVDITPKSKPEQEDLQDLFDYIHAQDMKIMFKTMLTIGDGTWRSFLHATPEWRVEYARVMKDAAEMAEEGAVELLSIGCEMGSWQVHTADVELLITEIREIYSGNLTYSANHDCYWQIDFWDKLDIIGIDAYYSFTLSYNPTLDDMIEVWNGFYEKLNKFQRKWDKPIIFPEVGRSGRDGSNIGHFFEESDVQDVFEAQLFYESFFESKLWSAPWFKGAYWWMWDMLDYDEQTDLSMAPDNPVIKFTIEKHYSGERNVIIPNYSLQTVLLIILGALLTGGIILLSNYVLSKSQGKLNDEKNEAEEEKMNRKEEEHMASYLGIALGASLFWTFTYLNETIFTTFIDWTILISIKDTMFSIITSLILIVIAVASISLTRRCIERNLKNKSKLTFQIVSIGYFIIMFLIFVKEIYLINTTSHDLNPLYTFINFQIMMILNINFVTLYNISIKGYNRGNKNGNKFRNRNMVFIVKILAIAIVFFLFLSIVLKINSNIPSLIVGISAFVILLIYSKKNEKRITLDITTTNLVDNEKINSDYHVVIRLFLFGYYFGILRFYDIHSLYTFNLSLLSEFFIPISLSILFSIPLIIGFIVLYKNRNTKYSLSDENENLRAFSLTRLKNVMIFSIFILIMCFFISDYANTLAILIGAIPITIVFFYYLIQAFRTNNKVRLAFFYPFIIAFSLNGGMVGIVGLYPYLNLNLGDPVQITYILQLAASMIIIIISILILFYKLRRTNLIH
ncbi:MAG: hypothetical protein GF364_00050 [Candidatus Lokiarchaeota archaeon]|nr:hypothetical protein [Candidatus Lokiarchaeota archaeon]